jgi:hypothetical protein
MQGVELHVEKYYASSGAVERRCHLFFFLEHDFTCHFIKKKKAESTAYTTQLGEASSARLQNHRESG